MGVNENKSIESIENTLKLIKSMNFEIDENELDNKSLEDLEKFIQSFDKEYTQANKMISQITEFLDDENILGGKKEEILKTCSTYQCDIERLYKDNRKIISLSYQLKKTNKKLENSLGLQFGIFSAVLSVLSFVLNNSKLLSYDDINFRNVLLINLSHILACAVMFYFAMWFIKPYKHSKGRVWTLTLIIIAICALIFLIAQKIIKI